LAVAIGYLFGGARPEWPETAQIGKTLVSSSMIDRVAAALGKPMVEVRSVQVVRAGLIDGSFGFGGEESPGRRSCARTGPPGRPTRTASSSACWPPKSSRAPARPPASTTPSCVAQHGDPAYARIDAPADRAQKAKLAALSPDDVTATSLAGEPITSG
jgi:phosphoglucomutase